VLEPTSTDVGLDRNRPENQDLFVDEGSCAEVVEVLQLKVSLVSHLKGQRSLIIH